MLTDPRLRNLTPKDKLYKVNDRDGLYAAVTSAGMISFRYNYSIHGRQKTITFDRYSLGGITLAETREPHDLRRTASTLQHEAEYNTDWVAKCLVNE